MRNNIFLGAVFAFAFCFGNKIKAQIPPPSVPLTGTYSSGSYTSTAYNIESANFLQSNTAIYSVKAGNHIHLTPSTTVTNLAPSGTLHLHIQQSPFEVVSYHPAGWSNVKQYDKFEIGIRLPDNVTNSIDNFFGNANITLPQPSLALNPYAVGVFTAPLGCGNFFDNFYVNPYNPDEISLEATFIGPLGVNQSTQTVYGFYYREYAYDPPIPPGTEPTYLSTRYLEDVNLRYRWRTRFTPKQPGTYSVTWKATISKPPVFTPTVVLQDNVGETFTVIPSSDKGFLKLGVNKKFLVAQPNPGQAEETVFPIGMNMPSPYNPIPFSVDPNYPPPAVGIPPSDCDMYGFCGSYNFNYPSRFWHHRNKIKTSLVANGGDFIRIIGSPSAYDIEYEKAGVYDAAVRNPLAINIPTANGAQSYHGVNRQTVMWEFDRMLDMAKQNDLHMLWLLWIADDGFGGANDDGSWAARNPYYNLPASPDPTYVDQFFNDPACIRAMKNRLRYTIARYGYSTNLTALELINELELFKRNNGKQIININGTIDQVIRPWIQEMADYIKKPISQGGLCHTEQLLSVSYAGVSDPILGFGAPDPNNNPPFPGDNIGSIPNLDFLSTHPYYPFDDKNRRGFISTEAFRTGFGKPCMITEDGLSGAPCGAGATISASPFYYKSIGTQLENLTESFHSILWSTSFTGGLTSGLEFWGAGLDVDLPGYQPFHNCSDGYKTHFYGIKFFMSGINFDAQKYAPHYYQNPFPSLRTEAFYMVNNFPLLGDHAIGYIRNRTYYWYNMTCTASPAPFYDQSLHDALITPGVGDSCGIYLFNGVASTIAVQTGFNETILIEQLIPQDYDVDWYNTYPDVFPSPVPPAYLFTQGYSAASVNGGSLFVVPPAFGANCFNQEYAFKLHPAGVPRPGQGDTTKPLALNVVKSATLNSPVKGNPAISNNSSINGKDMFTDQFSIYPNPGTGLYTILAGTAENYLITIYNAYGAIVRTETFSGRKKEINIQDLAAGLYTFNIQGEKSSCLKKIIKQN